jgi:hypothetical protein
MPARARPGRDETSVVSLSNAELDVFLAELGLPRNRQSSHNRVGIQNGGGVLTALLHERHERNAWHPALPGRPRSPRAGRKRGERPPGTPLYRKAVPFQFRSLREGSYVPRRDVQYASHAAHVKRPLRSGCLPVDVGRDLDRSRRGSGRVSRKNFGSGPKCSNRPAFRSVARK